MMKSQIGGFRWASGGTSDGPHYQSGPHKFGSRLLYPEETMCIYHVNPKFWVDSSVGVRSVKVTSYSFSPTFKNFGLLTSEVNPEAAVNIKQSNLNHNAEN